VTVLEPLVRAELDLGDYDAMPEQMAIVTVLLGISEHGQAGGVRIQIGRSVEVDWARAAILPSIHTTEFIHSIAPDKKLPPPGSTPRAIALHMRKLLRSAIAEAQRISGDQADVAGEVDVALAGPRGATLVKI